MPFVPNPLTVDAVRWSGDMPSFNAIHALAPGLFIVLPGDRMYLRNGEMNVPVQRGGWVVKYPNGAVHVYDAGTFSDAFAEPVVDEPVVLVTVDDAPDTDEVPKPADPVVVDVDKPKRGKRG